MLGDHVVWWSGPPFVVFVWLASCCGLRCIVGKSGQGLLILDETVVLSNKEDARTSCDTPVSSPRGGRGENPRSCRPSHPSSVLLPCLRHGARPGKALVAPAAAWLLRPLRCGADAVAHFPARAWHCVGGHGGGTRARPMATT